MVVDRPRKSTGLWQVKSNMVLNTGLLIKADTIRSTSTGTTGLSIDALNSTVSAANRLYSH